MKKHITILSFIVCFIASAQFVNAQETKKVRFNQEAIAKEKTHNLHLQVDLNGEQQREIFYLLVDAENNMHAVDNNGGSVSAMQARKREIQNHVNDKLRGILTPTQFRAYMQSVENQENANKASVDKK